MKCPSCSEVDLLMSERQGIEIDYCPKCRGVWLDRGELDKFVQQAERHSSSHGFVGGRTEARTERPSSEVQHHKDSRTPDQYNRHRQYDGDQDRGYNQPVKKKESFWGELFDFG